MNLDYVNKQLKGLHCAEKRGHVISYPAIEIEAKIDANSVICQKITHGFRNYRIDEISQRKEFHHYYERRTTSRTFIFVQGSNEVWIKEKVFIKLNFTLSKIPILIRREKKLKPTDHNYPKLFLETLKWHYVGSFYKECVDVSFWFENLLFTITFANATVGKAVLSQIELEYDGHSSNIKRPTMGKTRDAFDKVSHDLDSQITNKHFTTLTKLEWLKELKN